MDLFFSVFVSFIFGLGIGWVGVRLLYRRHPPFLNNSSSSVRFCIFLGSLVALAFVVDWLLSLLSPDAETRNVSGRVFLLAFSAGIIFKILLGR